jgi:tRNA nucleotidyltransferase (CCA-adding enzyme)
VFLGRSTPKCREHACFIFDYSAVIIKQIAEQFRPQNIVSPDFRLTHIMLGNVDHITVFKRRTLWWLASAANSVSDLVRNLTREIERQLADMTGAAVVISTTSYATRPTNHVPDKHLTGWTLWCGSGWWKNRHRNLTQVYVDNISKRATVYILKFKGYLVNLSDIITPHLNDLRSGFVARNRDLRFVGGCARDKLRGETPKDIDLCTDASPDEQIEVYKALGVAYYETGLQHGTITVKLADGEIYEITSLRTETDHDGRHATVSYTRDWLADLGRRDLTFNAIAITFDGEIIDPFNGVEDLKNGVVRFVGSPDDRMREDYLRILRWLRFQGRIAPHCPLDAETAFAAKRQAEGLMGISRERVWMEVSKIITGQDGPAMIQHMYGLGLAPFIDLPMGNVEQLRNMHRKPRNVTDNPVTMMVGLMMSEGGERIDYDAVTKLAANWKWSAAERDLALFLAKQYPCSGDYLRLMAYDGHPREHVAELARLTGARTLGDQIMREPIPVFPVKGQDLLDAGFPPGKEMGEKLKAMKLRWADSQYALTKADLMD